VADASVIVRARDKADTIERTLSSLRSQTIRPEIIVVDSGSRDGTVEIARRMADRVLEIAPEEFSYGGALNLGARAASAEIHFALSAHSFPERTDWIERSLAHYSNEKVAATAGMSELPDGRPMTEMLLQDLEHAKANPFWGYANHASSWRASVWERFPFDDSLPACEDAEWAWRVMAAGWRIVIDPALAVKARHRYSTARESYRRQKLEKAAIERLADLPPYRLRDCAREWWSAMPDRRHAPMLHRIDYRRLAYLAGKYRGLRATRHRNG
jgi:rhamnosyltransferase